MRVSAATMVFLCREGKWNRSLSTCRAGVSVSPDKGAKVSRHCSTIRTAAGSRYGGPGISADTACTFWHRHLSPAPVIKRASQFTLIRRVNSGFRPFLFFSRSRPSRSSFRFASCSVKRPLLPSQFQLEEWCKTDSRDKESCLAKIKRHRSFRNGHDRSPTLARELARSSFERSQKQRDSVLAFRYSGER